MDLSPGPLSGAFERGGAPELWFTEVSLANRYVEISLEPESMDLSSRRSTPLANARKAYLAVKELALG